MADWPGRKGCGKWFAAIFLVTFFAAIFLVTFFAAIFLPILFLDITNIQSIFTNPHLNEERSLRFSKRFFNIWRN